MTLVDPEKNLHSHLDPQLKLKHLKDLHIELPSTLAPGTSSSKVIGGVTRKDRTYELRQSTESAAELASLVALVPQRDDPSTLGASTIEGGETRLRQSRSALCRAHRTALYPIARRRPSSG